MKCSFTILILHVDVALGVDQEGHEAVELVFVTPPDVRVERCVTIVQVIHIHTFTSQILQHFLQTEGVLLAWRPHLQMYCITGTQNGLMDMSCILFSYFCISCTLTLAGHPYEAFSP